MTIHVVRPAFTVHRFKRAMSIMLNELMATELLSILQGSTERPYGERTLDEDHWTKFRNQLADFLNPHQTEFHFSTNQVFGLPAFLITRFGQNYPITLNEEMAKELKKILLAREETLERVEPHWFTFTTHLEEALDQKPPKQGEKPEILAPGRRRSA